MAKRLFDLFVSSLALLLLAPFLLVLAGLIKLDSRGPVFFRQERVGRGGKLFRIHKFRTMVIDAEHAGSQITIGADVRITRVGRWMRGTKLDELPQLFDVWIGHMSLVGPRPEVPSYVSFFPSDIRGLILSVRPGITDLASIKFREESIILGRACDPHSEYVNEILPVKCKYYAEYARAHTLLGDIVIISLTLLALLPCRPPRAVDHVTL
jgi:lipopolysaccharide/colanic/teichoic acid biosynthesis glycosyltransferase